MTPHEMHLAVLKELGWTETAYGWWENRTLREKSEKPPPLDLELIYQAEESLDPDQQELYIVFLAEGIVNPANPMDLYYLKHKSAPECARAFLRTKGLWKGDQV